MNIEEYLEQVSDIREYKRGQAVKLSEAGLSRREIAQALSVSEAFVSKWRGRYQQDGTAGLGLAYQGSKGFLTESQKETVLDWLGKQSGSVNVERLEGYVNEQYGVQYRSKQSYYDLLQLAGMSYKKRQTVNPKKDEQKVLERREEIKKSVSSSPADQPARDRSGARG
jgi:putative transposase